MNKEDYKYICDQLKKWPQLVHASNIRKKYNSCTSVREKNALDSLIPEYARYLRDMTNIDGDSRNDIERMVKYVNQYYDFMHSNNLEKAFSSQGKFRSTILEEFLFLLFRGYIEKFKKEHPEAVLLNSGQTKAYTNLYFKAHDFEKFVLDPQVGVNEKDQDYAIYRDIKVTINRTETLIRVPALAIEAKTYIDKTMLDSIIATAEKIKNGNPHSRFIAVAERYDVSAKVDPSYSRINQIYILRKTMGKGEWKEIDSEVVWSMYNESLQHLQRPWADIENKVKKEGKVL